MKFQRKKLAVLIAGAVGAGSVSMLVATQATAQVSIGTIEKKEITGSNIKRTETETASPVQVITRGYSALANPGSITPHTEFEAQIYVLSREEGGRHTPFFNGYRPQFYFRTTDVTGD